MKKRNRNATEVGWAVFYPDTVHITPELFDVVPLDPNESPWMPRDEHGYPVSTNSPVVAGIVGAYAGIVTPQDVRDEIAKMENDLATLQATANAANNPDAATLTAWDSFKKSWSDWLSAHPEVPILPIEYLSMYHDVVDFRQKARSWEPKLAAMNSGKLAGPSIMPRPSNVNPNQTWWTPDHIAEVAVGATLGVLLLGWLSFRYVTAPFR